MEKDVSSFTRMSFLLILRVGVRIGSSTADVFGVLFNIDVSIDGSVRLNADLKHFKDSDFEGKMLLKAE